MSVDYSRMAKDYDVVRGDEAVDRHFWLAALVEVGRITPGERVLDLGAGTGRFSRLVAEIAHVVAVDPSPAMIDQARAKGTPNLILADAHALPFRRDAFDVTLLIMVVHQLADYRKAMREVARVSHRAVIATSDMRTRTLGILEEAFPSLLAIDRARFPPVDELVTALKHAGFLRVEVEERPHGRTFTVAQELERVKRKYISTLDLLPPGEFDRGLAFLEKELPRRYGDTFETSASFTFVGASR
ncbi:MAG: methyltransferase domain-containing protein [Candidatus Thermoplasmatota archaeon]